MSHNHKSSSTRPATGREGNGAIDAAMEFDSMILSNKFRVKTDFYESVKQQFNEIYPALLIGECYYARDLCGEAFLAELTSADKRMATLCLRHLAQQPGSRLIDSTCTDSIHSCFEIAQAEA